MVLRDETIFRIAQIAVANVQEDNSYKCPISLESLHFVMDVRLLCWLVTVLTITNLGEGAFANMPTPFTFIQLKGT